MKLKITFLCTILLCLFITPGCNKDNTEPSLQSTTFTIPYSAWSWNSSSAFLFTSKSWDKITQSIYDEGTVEVYLKTSSGWAPLPRTIVLSGLVYDYAQSQRYTYNVGQINFYVQDDDLEQPNSFTDWEMKAIVISSSQRRANPDLNWKDYEQVSQRFNIIESK
jgi:hypothetical protein